MEIWNQTNDQDNRIYRLQEKKMKFETISFGSLTFLFDAAMDSAVTVDQQNRTITFSWGENMLDEYLIIGKDGHKSKAKFTPESAENLKQALSAYILAMERLADSRDVAAGEGIENIPQLKELVQQLQQFINEQNRKTKYRTIRQGAATNALTRARTVKDADINEETGKAIIDGTIIIANYCELIQSLNTTTKQLFHAIEIAFTESGSKSPTVILPLEEFMNMRGLKDRKEAKNQAKKAMDVLRAISIRWEEKKGGKIETYGFVNLADSGEIRRNGDIVFTFSATYFNALKSYPVMPYPPQLQQINARVNPSSFDFLYLISMLKNMNIGKSNEDILKVETLLNATDAIPQYEDVKEKSRHVSRLIIDRFERDMDFLAPTLTWEYCHRDKSPLTDEELESMDYDTFKDLRVMIHWKDYPERKPKILKQEKPKKIGTKRK